MDLTKIRYWQWVLISLVVGAAAVEIRAWAGGLNSTTSFPADLSGQERRFERALLGQVEGHQLLRDIRVSPLRLANSPGRARAAHLVRCEYCTGETEIHEGRREYVWRESLFVLPVPYPVAANLSQTDPALPGELSKRSRPGRVRTVLDLLDAARSAHGIRYSYAWWDAYPWLTFEAGSVLVIGFIFPALIHLATFGRLARPAEVDLRPQYLPAQGKKPDRDDTRPPDGDFAPAAVEAPEVESEDMHDSAPSIVPLGRGDELAGNAAAIEHEADFRMKSDDYYPTERGPGGITSTPKE